MWKVYTFYKCLYWGKVLTYYVAAGPSLQLRVLLSKICLCGLINTYLSLLAIESAWILKGHATASTISLAPQQIVDCDTIDGVEGCNGGETESAYQYSTRLR